MADWSELSCDLLGDIVTRLHTMDELVYFSRVCRSWYQFASTVKHIYNMKTTPWLLLAENNKNDRDCTRKVLNPVNNKCYQLNVPETAGCRCWGSAYGWVVTYNEDLDLHLFNPFTKTRTSLPPVTCLPHKWAPHVCIGTHANFKEGAAHESMKEFIKKAFVIKVGEDDFVVFVAYYFSWRKLAFARPGDESWTSIDQPGSTLLHPEDLLDDSSNCAVDVVCRGSQILILYEDASLGYVDVSDLSDREKLIVKDYVPIYPMLSSVLHGLKAKSVLAANSEILSEFVNQIYGLYLVECGGDLLMVIRDRYFLEKEEDIDKRHYMTNNFLLYKLDFDKKSWSPVNYLGKVALFVGNHSSMSICTVEAGIGRFNCIYYTDDDDESWRRPITLGGEDMGVFDLEKGDSEDIYLGCDKYSEKQTPLWFVPKF